MTILNKIDYLSEEDGIVIDMAGAPVNAMTDPSFREE